MQEVVLIYFDVHRSAHKEMENSNLNNNDNCDSNSETDKAATAKSSIALDHNTPKNKAIESISNKVRSDFNWCRRVSGSMFEANCILCKRNFGIVMCYIMTASFVSVNICFVTLNFYFNFNLFCIEMRMPNQLKLTYGNVH